MACFDPLIEIILTRELTSVTGVATADYGLGSDSRESNVEIVKAQT